ncbi:hypothetical protein B296_00043846 [Ensete ventricosum]|uniref:Uncharacterized protein n=1 Tax=Ensete ventricosum TaxID=4639 RepID=A0A426ZD34_ENSVE|nr:hypothetical protein B296_00043846 [Ensete ventricosum]
MGSNNDGGGLRGENSSEVSRCGDSDQGLGCRRLLRRGDGGREEKDKGGRWRKRRPRERATMKSGKRHPIDGERLATTRMVDGDGGR